MDTLDNYRRIIRAVLADYASIPYSYGEVQGIVVADPEGDHYLWMYVGWHGSRRIHGCIIHVDIIDGKIWIQHDGTEHGIALALEEAGIPKDQIVLAFHPPYVRPHTDYAVA